MDFFPEAAKSLFQPCQEIQKMVVNMGYNHCVQDMDTPQHPGEYGHKILVFQENVSCRTLVLVGCKEGKYIKDNETRMTQYYCAFVYLQSRSHLHFGYGGRYQNKLFSGLFNLHDTQFLLLITIQYKAGW